MKDLSDAHLEKTLRRRVKAGFTVAILLTLALGVLSWRNERRAVEDADWVADTHEVSTDLELALRHLLDAETGGRGFAVTGEEQFLEPYESGKVAVVQDLQALRLLIVDGDQKLRLEVLETQAKAELGDIEEFVAARRMAHSSPKAALLEQGKQDMDTARMTVAWMEARQETLLEQRIQRARSAQYLGKSGIALGSILGAIFLCFAGLTVNREIGISARARAQIGALNTDLERRVAERTAALGESEERFQAMANGIPQLACMAAADGAVFWYNQRWYDYTGTTPEQMEGWGWQSVLGPAVLPSVLERWTSAIASGEPFEMEFPLRRADGVFGTFLTRVVPLKDAAGRVTRWFGTNTDISERKQTEVRLAAQAQELSISSQSLEAQTRVFKLVLESMGEGLIAADRDGRFIIWNDSARNLMGRGAADLPSEQWTPHYRVFLPDGVTPYPPDRLPLVLSLHGESVQVELMVENPDREGGVFMEVTARPMKDAEANLCGGVAVLHDITQRKRADAVLARQAQELSRQTEELLRSRQALEAQTRMLKLVLDSMGEGLVAADREGRFIIWNDAAKKLMGQGAADLSSEQWTPHYKMYLADGDTPYPTDDLPLVRALRGESVQAEMMIQQADNEPGIFLEATARPMKDAEGNLCGGVVAFRDVSGRKAAEREIQQLNRDLEARVIARTAELQAANAELEAFTYSVSHDLRAPLRHMTGFAKILVEDFGPSVPEEAQKYLLRVESAALSMGQLVDALLNLARVRRQALTVQATDLGAIVKDILAMLEPESEGRQIEWKIAELPSVECDPALIRLVFQNLIGNALKYSRPRSPAVIEIGQIQEKANLTIFVRDNGVGFSTKYAYKLFGVFQRLHPAEDFEGTGVGLATVQRIIQKHGGRIWAEAELDHGATFYFTLGAGERSPEKAVAAAGGQL